MDEGSPEVHLRGDFNGLFGDSLCLSHTETCCDPEGNPVVVRTGMRAIATEMDIDERGDRDDLIASGTVEPATGWLADHGSRWVLRIDDRGVRHRSHENDVAPGT